MNDELNWDYEVSNAVEAGNEIRELTGRAIELKEKIASLEHDLKSLKSDYTEVSNQILKILDLTMLDKVSANGHLFYKDLRQSVTIPRTIEDKKRLFEYLQSKDMFYDFVSVNSMTLNALYKSLADDALKEGNLDFELPGVGKPTSYTTLKLKKG